MVDKSSANGPLQFGIENDQDNYNCFLNVCLQTLWQINSIRETLRDLCNEDDSWTQVEHSERAHRNLLSFIRSLKKFFQPLLSSTPGGPIPVLCSKEIRTELFISNYLQKSFDIYDKGDANEALRKIIGMIHAYKTYKASGHVIKDLEKAIEADCRLGNQTQEPCTIHKAFF